MRIVYFHSGYTLPSIEATAFYARDRLERQGNVACGRELSCRDFTATGAFFKLVGLFKLGGGGGGGG